MPSQQVYFSIPPINEIATSTNGDALEGGYSVDKGNQFVKFQISAQDRLLDTSDMYLTFQVVNVDSNGTPVRIRAGTTQATFDANQGATVEKQTNLNISNWSGVQNAFKKVTLQSLKSAVTIHEDKNYPMLVSAKNAHTFSKTDYIDTPLTRYQAGGVEAGNLNRHSVLMSNATNASGGETTNITDINDQQYGHFVSFRLDTGLLNSKAPLHLGNDFLGGLLINLELNNSNGYFYQRFQDVGTGQTNAGIDGTFYILKNMRLTGRFAVPTPQDLQDYQAQMVLPDSIELQNTIQSSVNSSKYTPQVASVKSFVNLFLDQDQENNIAQNQSNFRPPLGLRSYQQNKQNVRNPQDFVIDVVPNLLDTTSDAPNNNITYSAVNVVDKVAVQGDAEVRANFQRSILNGRLADKTSASLALSNRQLANEYEQTRATSGVAQTEGVLKNTDADCVGVGIDYTNAMGNSSNFFQRDYDLITRSGVASGNTNLPESRKSKAETQETYVRNNSSFNTKTLQLSYV